MNPKKYIISKAESILGKVPNVYSTIPLNENSTRSNGKSSITDSPNISEESLITCDNTLRYFSTYDKLIFTKIKNIEPNSIIGGMPKGRFIDSRITDNKVSELGENASYESNDCDSIPANLTNGDTHTNSTTQLIDDMVELINDELKSIESGLPCELDAKLSGDMISSNIKRSARKKHFVGLENFEINNINIPSLNTIGSIISSDTQTVFSDDLSIEELPTSPLSKTSVSNLNKSFLSLIKSEEFMDYSGKVHLNECLLNDKENYYPKNSYVLNSPIKRIETSTSSKKLFKKARTNKISYISRR